MWWLFGKKKFISSLDISKSTQIKKVTENVVLRYLKHTKKKKIKFLRFSAEKESERA